MQDNQADQSVDLSFTNTKPVGSLADLPNLRRLNLGGCHWVDDAVLAEIATTQISDLNLYWCVHATDEGVSRLIERNKEITKLVLSGCNKLTDLTMKTIAKFLHQLRGLDLTRVPLVTDAGLSEIAASPIADSLEELNLYAKVQNIDPSFYATIGNFKNLRSLDLCGHLKFTDEIAAALVPQLPLLTKLNLSWCVEIGDSTVDEIARSRVTWLSLFGIKKISEDAIERLLLSRGAAFVGLDIRGIPNVRALTQSDCAELRRRLPQLEEWKIHT